MESNFWRAYPTQFMLPALDQLNHPFDNKPNAWRTNDGEWVHEYAQAPIKQGEQVGQPRHLSLGTEQLGSVVSRQCRLQIVYVCRFVTAMAPIVALRRSSSFSRTLLAVAAAATSNKQTGAGQAASAVCMGVLAELRQMPCLQITHVYHPGNTHRPDLSFAVYGFVMKNDPPVLCAQDLPGFEQDDPFRDTPASDEEAGEQMNWCAAARNSCARKMLLDCSTSIPQVAVPSHP
jgi:hypothetical protein